MSTTRAVVERSARRDSRICCGGKAALAHLKRTGHKRYRQQMRETIARVVTGQLDADVADWQPRHPVTGWDVA